MTCLHHTGTKIKRQSLIALLLLVLLFATCKKSKTECIGNAFSLKQTWNIAPQKDSIRVGDTLIFDSEFSDHPYDYESGTPVDFSGASTIGTSFGIRSIKGYNNLTPAIDSFQFFSLKGRYQVNASSPKQLVDIYWLLDANKLKIQFGIVAQKKGDYIFAVPDGLGNLKQGGNECDNSAYIYMTETNVDNNAELMIPYYGSPHIPATDSIQFFCIKVY